MLADTKENLLYFKKHTNTKLSHCIKFESQIPGPTIVFSGATHGDEPAGVRACIELHKKLVNKEIALLEGQVIFLIANPDAYLENVRFINTNLNRSFIELPNANQIEGKRVLEIRKFLSTLDTFELLLDMHSITVGEFKILIYFDYENHKKLAIKISNLDFHFIPTPETVPGSLMQEAMNFAAKAYAIECGNHQSPNGQIIAYNQMLSILEYYNMIKDLESTQAPDIVEIFKVIDTVIPGPGFEYTVRPITKTFITKGQQICKYQDSVKLAMHDCYLIMPDPNPNLDDLDAGFLCTKEIM